MTKEYEKDNIAIVWKPHLCTISTNCCVGLSSVFKPEARPWIQPENGSKEEIIDQVAKCPSGALTIKGLNVT